ncbi:trypsin-like serine peptidase [Kitasatospora griseola]|uniref:trypsin-like serine peptidase n=1 Tax=Kitasatospora griseola TaxID=2064 RepID=UPI003444F757
MNAGREAFEPDVALATAVAQIRTGDGTVVGAGFLIAEDLLISCAHVLEDGGYGVGDEATLVFPRAPGAPSARGLVLQEGWRDSTLQQDIALVRLDRVPAGTAPLLLGSAVGCSGHRMRSFGFPAQARPDGHFGSAVAVGLLPPADGTGELLQLTGANDLTTGFSGGPILDETTGLVVGMLTEITVPDRYNRGEGIAHATPTAELRKAWPALNVQDVSPYRALDPVTGPGSGPRRRITPVRAAGGTVVALALVAAVVVGQHWYSNRAAVRDVAAHRQAEKSVDQHTLPFQVVVDGPDLRRQGVWAFALDRPLSPAEQAGLAPFKPEDLAGVRAYLEPLGARLLPQGAAPEVSGNTHDPALDVIEQREKQGMVGGDTYRLHFTSDRSSSVTIANIGTTDVSCRPSSAVSSVVAPSAGTGSVPSVFLSLAVAPDTPAVEVDDEGFAVSMDYFAHNKLDLGQATTPGDIAVQVGGVTGQVCSWAFKVDYLTSEGKFTAKVDNRGKPFTVETLPTHLAQKTSYYLGGATNPAHWMNCADEPTRCDMS